MKDVSTFLAEVADSRRTVQAAERSRFILPRGLVLPEALEVALRRRFLLAPVLARSRQASSSSRVGVPSNDRAQIEYWYRQGVRVEPNSFIKRVLKPVLKQLGLDGGAHAFRHGNATLLDSLLAPMAVRQERLGHVDATTTMGYTHLITSDDVRVAEQLGAHYWARNSLPKFTPDVETASELISEAV